jgi:hypothetical protein
VSYRFFLNSLRNVYRHYQRGSSIPTGITGPFDISYLWHDSLALVRRTRARGIGALRELFLPGPLVNPTRVMLLVTLGLAIGGDGDVNAWRTAFALWAARRCFPNEVRFVTGIANWLGDFGIAFRNSLNAHMSIEGQVLAAQTENTLSQEDGVAIRTSGELAVTGDNAEQAAIQPENPSDSNSANQPDDHDYSSFYGID